MFTDETKVINPIYALALKHNITLTENNWDDLNFYDETGVNPKGFKERFDAASDSYDALVEGATERIKRNLVDLTARGGYQLTDGRNTRNKFDWASEYYNYDWEYAQTPEVRVPFASELSILMTSSLISKAAGWQLQTMISIHSIHNWALATKLYFALINEVSPPLFRGRQLNS